MIGLLNCIGKIVEKVVTEKLFQYCESYFKLCLGQIDDQKKKSAIDAIAALIHTVQKKWTNKKLAEALFLDVKKACDQVSKA